MGIKLQRGHVEDMKPAEKEGWIDCRIGEYQVKVHPNISKVFGAGDEVIVAGEVKDKVLNAYAVKNFKQGKSDHIDATNNIILLGIASYVWILCGVFGLESSDGDWVGRAQDLASIIGFVISIVALRRIVVFNRASNWINYAEINDAAKGTTP